MPNDTPDEEIECGLCGGCGEVEVDRRDTLGRDTVPCPDCISREIAEEREKRAAEVIRLTAENERLSSEVQIELQMRQEVVNALSAAERKLAEIRSLIGSPNDHSRLADDKMDRIRTLAGDPTHGQ
jgi:hypothetical protein